MTFDGYAIELLDTQGGNMSKIINDLRQYIDICKELDACQLIEGADWDLEIGALCEAVAERVDGPPMLLFEKIKGYEKGGRVVGLPYASSKRVAIALGLDHNKSELELVRDAANMIQAANANPIAPREVVDSPVMQNVMTGAEVDLNVLPTPRYHADDGGRYIGVGHSLLNRDPDSGFVNMGCYRLQIHERNLLGSWVSPGNDARLIYEKYWSKGEACPVAIAIGTDPLTFTGSWVKLQWGHSELDFVGGLRGEPLDIIKGPITGLPIPAHAEIVMEGEVPPPGVEARPEGPFGEWPGYYSGGTIGTGENQPVVRVQGLYYRDNPILVNVSPMWTGAPLLGLPFDAGVLWNQLEGAGIQGIKGCYTFLPYLVVVAIEQRYPGHAKQVGLATVSCAVSARNGRYVVVVDDDIDITNIKEVLWAMQTRVDPYTDIELIDGCWSTPLDPRMPPHKRTSGDYTNSRAIFYATRPWEWRNQFPKVSRASKALRDAMATKYKELLRFS